jgi:two-component system response regulator PilR (NtrC family)
VSRILVVDDEASLRELLGIMLTREGFDVVAVETREAAAEALARQPIDLVITDIRLPDGDGMDILRHVRAAAPETGVIVMTAYGSTQTAVAAMKLGAHDYLVKPFDLDELSIVVRNALDRQALERENRLLKADFRARHAPERIIAMSPAMIDLLEMARTVAETGSTILITGESGTGKELIARSIHAVSPRRDKAFVSINCGALPETLLESELFGHVKGAFTDAHQHKKGLFEVAHLGTLFLDEIGETPPAMQVKLLRALQERQIRRVGGTEEIGVDVRVIAATNRPLDSLLRDGRLRQDLFYRINVIHLHLPALRERREDVPILAGHFLERFREQMGKSVTGFSDEALEALESYGWPGNVRELENVVERAVALETTATIRPERLPPHVLLPADAADVTLEPGFCIDAYLRSIEAALVRRALRQSRGRRVDAARLLGISERSVRYLLKKHALEG